MKVKALVRTSTQTTEAQNTQRPFFIVIVFRRLIPSH